MSSFFSRVRAGLARTAAQIRERLTDLSDRVVETPAARSSAASLAEIEDALIGADVGLPATERILAAVKQAGAAGPLRDRVGQEIKRVFAGAPPPADTGARPRVVLIVGVNGTGKTTSVGKLANLF